MSVFRLRGARAVAPSVQQIPRSLMLALLDARIASSIAKDGSDRVSSWTDVITGQAYVQATAENKPTDDGSGWVAAPGAAWLRNTNAYLPTSGAFWAWVLADAQNVIPAAAFNPTLLAWPNSAAGSFGTIRQAGGTGYAGIVCGNGSSNVGVNGTGRWGGRSLVVMKVDGATVELWKDGALEGSVAGVPSLSGGPRNTLFATAAATAGAFWTGSLAVAMITRPLPAQWEAVAMADLMAHRSA